MAVPGRALNLAMVLEHATRPRLFWESVEIIHFFGRSHKSNLRCGRTRVLSAAIHIDEAQFLGQRQSLRHGRLVIPSCVDKRHSRSPGER